MKDKIIEFANSGMSTDDIIKNLAQDEGAKAKIIEFANSGMSSDDIIKGMATYSSEPKQIEQPEGPRGFLDVEGSGFKPREEIATNRELNSSDAEAEAIDERIVTADKKLGGKDIVTSGNLIEKEQSLNKSFGNTDGLEEGSDIIFDILGAVTGLSAVYVGGKVVKKAIQNRGLPKQLRVKIEDNPEMTKEVMETLKFAKANDLRLFDAIISGDTKKINRLHGNMFEAEKLASYSKTFEESEMETMTKLLDDIATHKTYDELGTKAGKTMKEIRENFRAEENTLWGKAKEEGQAWQANTKDLQKGIVDYLREENVGSKIINQVNRELFVVEKAVTKEEKASMKLIANLQAKIKASDSPAQIGRMKAQIGRVKETLVDVKKVETMTGRDLMDLVKRLNEDLFIKGSSTYGATDKAARRHLTNVRNIVEGFIKEKNTRPAFEDSWTKAKEKSRERFNMFGPGDKGNKDLPEMAKLINTENTEAIVKQLVESGNNFKLKEIVKHLDKETGTQLIRRYLDASLKNVENITPDKLTDAFGGRVDTHKLNKSLDNLLSKDNIGVLNSTIGPEKVRDLKSLSRLSRSMDKTISKINGRETELSGGKLNYLLDNGFLMVAPRAIKMSYHALGLLTRKLTPGLSPSTYWSTQKLDKLIKGLERLDKRQTDKMLKEAENEGDFSFSTFLASGGRARNEKDLARQAGGGLPESKPIKGKEDFMGRTEYTFENSDDKFLIFDVDDNSFNLDVIQISAKSGNGKKALETGFAQNPGKVLRLNDDMTKTGRAWFKKMAEDPKYKGRIILPK